MRTEQLFLDVARLRAGARLPRAGAAQGEDLRRTTVDGVPTVVTRRRVIDLGGVEISETGSKGKARERVRLRLTDATAAREESAWVGT